MPKNLLFLLSRCEINLKYVLILENILQQRSEIPFFKLFKYEKEKRKIHYCFSNNRIVDTILVIVEGYHPDKVKYQRQIQFILIFGLTLSPTRGGFRSPPLEKILIALNFA